MSGNNYSSPLGGKWN